MNIEPHHNNNTHTTMSISGTRSGPGRSARKKEVFILAATWTYFFRIYWDLLKNPYTC